MITCNFSIMYYTRTSRRNNIGKKSMKKLICMISRRVLEYFLSRDTYRYLSQSISSVRVFYYYYIGRTLYLWNSYDARKHALLGIVFVFRSLETKSWNTTPRLCSTNEKLLLLRYKSCSMHDGFPNISYFFIYPRRDGNTYSFFHTFN